MSEVSDSECLKAIHAIEELGDGDLGYLGRQRLGRHARRCERCAGELNRMKILLDALSDLNSVRAPEDLVDTVMRYLDSTFHLAEDRLSRIEGKRKRLWLLGGLVVAVAATTLGAAGLIAMGVVKLALAREKNPARESGEDFLPAATA